MTILNRAQLADTPTDFALTDAASSSPRPIMKSFDILLWFALGAAYLGAGFATVWRSGDPVASAASATASWFAFMIDTFRFHLGLGTTVGIAIAAIRRRGVLVLAGVPLWIACMGPTVFGAMSKPTPPAAAEDFTLMSANLLRTNDQNSELFLQQVDESDPDVLVLQEYSYAWHEQIGARLEELYPYRQIDLRIDAYGCAVYSSFPIVGTPQLRLPLGNQHVGHMRVVLEKDSRAFVLYNTHLANPGSVASLGEQRAQLASLRDMVQKEMLPAIVCGDFNETVRSDGLRFFADLGFRDTGVATGGTGPTWHARMPMHGLLGVRIDHVFFSSPFSCLRQRLGRPFGSDHLPIIADFAMLTPRNAPLSPNVAK